MAVGVVDVEASAVASAVTVADPGRGTEACEAAPVEGSPIAS